MRASENDLLKEKIALKKKNLVLADMMSNHSYLLTIPLLINVDVWHHNLPKFSYQTSKLYHKSHLWPSVLGLRDVYLSLTKMNYQKSKD